MPVVARVSSVTGTKLNYTVRNVFKEPHALCVVLCSLPVMFSAVCVCRAVISAFFSGCVSSETLPRLSWAGLPSSVSLLHSVTHFPSPALFFPLHFPSVSLLVSSSASAFLLALSLSPPTGAVRIPARRGGGVCDPASIRTRPPPPPLHVSLPHVRPHPLPGKMGAPPPPLLLPGRASALLWVCCQPWQQRLNMICLSAAACLHQTLAPTPITTASDPEGWLAGRDLERGSWRGSGGLKEC